MSFEQRAGLQALTCPTESAETRRVYLQAMSQLAQALESVQLMAVTAGIGEQEVLIYDVGLMFQYRTG